jgi:hypothetical protein
VAKRAIPDASAHDELKQRWARLIKIAMKIQLGLILFSLYKGCSSGDSSVAFFGADDGDADEYADWLKNAVYERHTFLSSPHKPNDGMSVHWTIQGEEIRLAVAARATGWLGFGT